MIVRPLGPDALFYRALTPSWAHLPESGAGAARVGARFNRPNVEARYLAATHEAALLEYQAESPLLPPATVATYRVTAESVRVIRGFRTVTALRGRHPARILLGGSNGALVRVDRDSFPVIAANLLALCNLPQVADEITHDIINKVYLLQQANADAATQSTGRH